MRERVRDYRIKREVKLNDGVHVVVIYAELTETTKLYGYKISEVEYKRGGTEIISEKNPVIFNRATTRNKTKILNWGWAICAPDDKFDWETAIKICKNRFSKNPLTTHDGKLLTDDIVWAIVYNELNFHANKLKEAYKNGDILKFKSVNPTNFEITFDVNPEKVKDIFDEVIGDIKHCGRKECNCNANKNKYKCPDYESVNHNDVCEEMEQEEDPWNNIDDGILVAFNHGGREYIGAFKETYMLKGGTNVRVFYWVYSEKNDNYNQYSFMTNFHYTGNFKPRKLTRAEVLDVEEKLKKNVFVNWDFNNKVIEFL